MRTNLPDYQYFLGKSVPTQLDIEIVSHVASGNDGHVFKGFSSSLQKDVACKVIPRSNLIHGPTGEPRWQAEVHKADALRNPAVVKFERILEWNAGDCPCILLVSEFVQGPSLKTFVKESGDEVSMPFVVNFLATILNLFYEMKEKKVNHGDLHLGNILVEDRSDFDLLGPKYVFRVTDFGVADASSEQRFRDDYHQLADVVNGLLRLIKYTELAPKDKFAFKVIRDEFVGRSLVEHDLTRDAHARQPDQLLLRLQGLGREFEKTIASDEDALSTPFDFLSCEQIDTPAILETLYSERFLGLKEIASRNNTVVTGPRGCGKSTVFKALSLEHKIKVGKSEPSDLEYIGIYYRCDDLYFAFPRFASPDREDAINVPVHFVTSTLISRLLDSLDAWAKLFFADDFAEIEPKISEQIWRILRINSPQTPNANSFASISSKLHKERIRAAERHRFVHDKKRKIGYCFGPDVIQSVCSALQQYSFLRERPIYFFIDDYSSPKVSEALQANLNRVFMHRSSACFYKISTESSVSFLPKDIDGKTYVENREFSLHNLGLAFLHADLTAKNQFIEDVLQRRLNASPNFPIKDLHHLIGVAESVSNNELAKQIREHKSVVAWGRNSIAELCSGDIHYVIGLVAEMVRLAGGANELDVANSPAITPKTQNRAIRDWAGGFLKNLSGIPKVGEKLVAVVQAFGNIAHSHLRFIDSKNEESLPPKQATRIEPYEALKLNAEARHIYDELLRYSVFLEDFRGKSRRGLIVPRLYLRRFLIPHFNLTYSKRDSIELEPQEFELFLLNPLALEKAKSVQKKSDETKDRQPFLEFDSEEEQ
jgi:serine/threonine protein kinase